jgi:hypothetical protein
MTREKKINTFVCASIYIYIYIKKKKRGLNRIERWGGELGSARKDGGV